MYLVTYADWHDEEIKITVVGDMDEGKQVCQKHYEESIMYDPEKPIIWDDTLEGYGDTKWGEYRIAELYVGMSFY